MKRLLIASATVLSFAASEVAARCSSTSSDSLISHLAAQAPGLRPDVLRLAIDASACAAQRGLVKRRELLTVIDYSIASTEPRLFVFDLGARELLFRELVAHGKNSGGNLPTSFSNVHGSLATSLGLFVTAGTYVGRNGYSLRLRGLEKGVNDKAWDRAIVMHGAPYVSSMAIKALGRLGRSWGCPAVRSDVARKLINTIRGGSPIFAYYPDREWLASSRFLSPVQIARAE
ncbi:MAG TPA: murein L,D-transpeptidase catalytic domain family protein [Thermoanaerobaculia bacterium]|nr:murein L,D-transpeptidase catalytic domain family protein [Thermoanaerobaculia bacterium]